MNRFLQFPKWLREMLTEVDNVTPDFLRILAVVGVIVFLVLACVNHAGFSPIEFGTGLGAVLLAAGGAVRLNEGPVTPAAGPTTTIRSESTTINQ
jgi:hypothetical protein